jgi:hypothetical protein
MWRLFHLLCFFVRGPPRALLKYDISLCGGFILSLFNFFFCYFSICIYLMYVFFFCCVLLCSYRCDIRFSVLSYLHSIWILYVLILLINVIMCCIFFFQYLHLIQHQLKKSTSGMFFLYFNIFYNFFENKKKKRCQVYYFFVRAPPKALSKYIISWYYICLKLQHFVL